MKRPKQAKAAQPHPRKAAPPALDESPAEALRAEEPKRRVIERPDGFYWETVGGGEESGPFPTLAEAEADMLSGGAEFGEGESLQEAESEVGIAEWIDPDTGDPAEDSVPRIEDH